MAQINKSELLPIMEQIERDKGIKKEDILHMIEQALVSAYRKHAGMQVNVEAVVDADAGQIRAYVVKTIVETVTNPAVEITAADAKRFRGGVLTETELRIPVDAEEFARIAAQTAKQVLIQKFRETERESLYTEYKPKEGQMVNGQVLRFANRNVVVDLGRAEAILPPREQVRRERWMAGDRVRAIILKVEKGPRGPEVILSRASPDFVKKLFEQEVPEIYEKTVEVVEVAREPGLRSKVVVRSNNPKVDPIGACVGVKGSRVRPIINELQGERIDLVAWTNESAAYIANALSPAKPLLVQILSHEEKRAEVLVPDDQLALAIGKGGQNVRLAAKLTGWAIDVRSETQKKEAASAAFTVRAPDLSNLEGFDEKLIEALKGAGWNDLKKLSEASLEEIGAIEGVGAESAAKVIEAAKAGIVLPEPEAEEVAADEEASTEKPEAAVESENAAEAPKSE